MTAKVVRMDEGGGGGGACAEDFHPQEDNCDGNITSTDATKTKRNQKQQRRRITGGGGGGGGGILKNLTRRGSLGSYLNENFDSGDANTMTDSKLVLKCQVKLTLNSLTRSRFLFLYEDVLICAKQKSSTSFHVKNRVDLRDIWLEEDDEDYEEAESADSCTSTSFRLGWPIANVELEFPTTNERNSWVEKLRTLLTSIRDKDADHVIVRLVKNDEKYSVTKSLIVGKRESAKKILGRCTKEFHRASDTSGFQLQALMSKNDIPVPLTGREILYRIQMKYNREHSSDGCKDPTAENETEPLGDGLIFQMIHATEKKSTILKRSLATGDDNKPAKRASPLARFFRTTFKMADEGRLYRRNVNELYGEGKLCWRLMMMLSHLYLNGPSYEEVFRRPPALKVHRILQEKLDRGRDFNFDKVNACEMAALLKSFLSCLPESLLTTKLYSEWSEIPRQKSRSEAISLAKNLVDRLPECNRVLLRHLICVLHRIAGHCEVNGMPPKSLSICIGQCMLWLPPLKHPTAAASSELHSELHRFGIANSVTEILIESAPEIFGESCLRLFDHLLDRQSLLSTNSMKETSNVGCSLETENFRRELVRETSSSDRSGIIRSVSCLNYSTMSLTDESKGNEIELLREVNEEVALKLNSSWHLSGSTAFQRKSAFVGSQRQPSLNSSLNSSQMDLFPEKTSIKDEDEDDDDGEELGIKIEPNAELFPTLNETPAEKEKLLPFTDVDPPVAFKDLDSSSCASKEDPSEVTLDLLAATESSHSGLSDETLSVKDDQDLSNESKSNTAELFSHSCLENTSPDSVHRKDSLSSKTTSVQCLESSPVIEIIAETGKQPALASSNAAKDLDQSIEVGFNNSAQSLTVSPTTNSIKSHPQTLVMPSPKPVLATGCEDELPVIGNAKNWTLLSETSVNEAVAKHSEPNISTPDEGYHSLSNNTCRGSVTSREFDLPSSRLERNFLSYTEDLSQAKLSHRAPSTSPLDASRTRATTLDSSSLQREAPTARSSSSVKSNSMVTPSGIVRRLTSQIVERESSVSGPPPSPLSLKSVVSTRTKCHGPISPSFKEATFADACSPSSGSVCTVSSTSEAHSPLRHSNRESCQNLHKGDLDKSSFVDPSLVSDSQLLPSRDEKNSQPGLGQKSRSHSVKSSDDAEKRSTSIGSCSKVSSTSSRELTKRHADPANDKTKPPTEPTNPHDSIADIKSNKMAEGELLQGKELAITDTYDILDKSTKPPLRNPDPKPVTAPCAKRAPMERSNSDVNGTPASQDKEAMNTENKENLLRYQQLKRLSITRQMSTPEKLSKISGDANDIREIEDETSCSAEIKQMSVKDRDWHKELTEQYTKPAASANSSSVEPQATAVGKKSPQRSALIGPKISFTPMPLMVFQGNASRGIVTTAARKT